MLFHSLVLGLLVTHVTSQLTVTSPVDHWHPSNTYTALMDISVDAAGNVYVIDSQQTSDVWKITADGTAFGAPYPLQTTSPEMSQPFGVFVNSNGIYVADRDFDGIGAPAGTTGFPRLVVFDAAGAFVRAIPLGATHDSVPRRLVCKSDGSVCYLPVNQDGAIYAVPTNGVTPVTKLFGTGGANLLSPMGAPTSVQFLPGSSESKLVVVDAQNLRILTLDIATDELTDTFGIPQVADGIPLRDITFDDNGDLYVCGELDSKVYQMIGFSNTLRTTYTNVPGGFQCGSIEINPAQQLLVGDTESNEVLTFNPATVNGDPQFMGFQQQSFQVHGASNEYFNLVTSPSLQINSRFVYLASGVCNYNNTECWTHPGTYVDQIGLMLPNLNIHLIAGPHSKGMHLKINDNLITPSKTIYHIPIGNGTVEEQHVDIHYVTEGHVMITTPLLSLDVMNSDWFFNTGFSLHHSSARLLHAGREKHTIKSEADLTTFYPAYPLHGLVGQTWRNARYAEGRMYQGDIMDYMVAGGMWSTRFMYNLYQEE